jgi:succinate dehydrogenase / fumarate reductase iron-sulfur subunit
MGTERHFRVWRGDSSGGDIEDYDVEVNDGEVVLDIIHRLQATQTPDLACRWNCKAGKCGSCSMEINGMPRLGCMTRMATFEENETVTITPLRTFPVIRDLVTDVSFNYQKARETPAFAPPKGVAPGQYRMQQVDVERSQEFRKCIECFLCQNTCHVVRDHEENKPGFSGPRSFIRAAELDMHPLDARTDRKEYAQAHQGLGYCNITKCCTEVCPEHIKITDNAIIPMKERVVDRRYDPLVWLGRKIFRRDELEQEQQPVFAAARSSATASANSGSRDVDDFEVHTSGTPFTSARRGEAAPVGADGKLDVSELAAPHQAAPSPFGDEQEFPLPAGEFTYVQPSKPEEDLDNNEPH